MKKDIINTSSKEEKSSISSVNYQPSLFENYNVIAHEADSETILCRNSRQKSRSDIVEQIKENQRKVKGIDIARKFDLKRENGAWQVPSESKHRNYNVSLHPLSCDCPDYESRGGKCKHIYAAQYRQEHNYFKDLSREQLDALPQPASRPTYPQAWSAYNRSQQTEKIEFQRLLRELCKGISEPSQTTGRPRLPLEDMLFAVVFKVYSTFSGRRFTTDLNDAKEKGFISETPHFNSVLRYFDKEMLTPYLQMMIEESSLPLTALEEDFAIDASGLSSSQGFTWHYAKYDEPRLMAKKNWVKIHICTGVLTNIVTAVKVTSQSVNDHGQFRELLENTGERFQMRSVSADKAYLSNHNLNVAAMNDVVPFIAFKQNSMPGKSNSVWNKLYYFYSMHQEKFLAEYHKRSNVETTFHMIKSKFSGNVRAKNRTSQTNEALCKILAHNICVLIQSMNEFGVKPDFWE